MKSDNYPVNSNSLQLSIRLGYYSFSLKKVGNYLCVLTFAKHSYMIFLMETQYSSYYTTATNVDSVHKDAHINTFYCFE